MTSLSLSRFQGRCSFSKVVEAARWPRRSCWVDAADPGASLQMRPMKRRSSSTPYSFNSRRSPVYSTHGMVATSQPLASEVGLRILRAGGNAADIAVAVAAALNVTEPCSTGIGGDCFCLFYDAKDQRVRALNGSGRSPAALSIQHLRAKGYNGLELPEFDVNCITVPGTAAGWVDTVENFGSGRLSLQEILQPAIDLAEEGYPVAPVASMSWAAEAAKLRKASPNGHEMLLEDHRAPRPGEIMRLPNLASTFREVAQKGKPGFYEGRVAEEIVAIVQSLGGVMTLEDLQAHTSTLVDPIKLRYGDVDVWECAPNGQGLAALMALNILKNIDLADMDHNSADYLHVLIEAMRLAFADARAYIADPEKVHVPVNELLSQEYGATRAALLKMDEALADIEAGQPLASSDTVYFAVVDAEGNACSFIQSNYMGFGSGVIPKGCGFTLQNRGHNFTLDETHPNALAPGKRPYHTIIPAMVTRNDELWLTYGVMGGFMQPQGHVQTLLNMVEFGMDSQEAVDAPRFCITRGLPAGTVCLELGIHPHVVEELRKRGHKVELVGGIGHDWYDTASSGSDRSLFGRGQIIAKHGRVLCAGSDPRADGLAIGW